MMVGDWANLDLREVLDDKLTVLEQGILISSLFTVFVLCQRMSAGSIPDRTNMWRVWGQDGSRRGLGAFDVVTDF